MKNIRKNEENKVNKFINANIHIQHSNTVGDYLAYGKGENITYLIHPRNVLSRRHREIYRTAHKLGT